MQDEITDSSTNINCIPHPDPILAAEGLNIFCVQRLIEKVRGYPAANACWLWTGETAANGPKMTRGGGRTGTIASRNLMWLVYYGPLPGGWLRTSCANPACVSPHHLCFSERLAAKVTMPPINLIRAASLIALDPEQDPTLPIGFSRSFRARFWAKVDKKGPDDCWLWTGGTKSDGYGCIGKGVDQTANAIGAHIASWVIHNGPISEGMWVLHRCPGDRDIRKCVNPGHLYLGTIAENVRDAMTKCRLRGNGHWNASKVTAESVKEIRRLYDSREQTNIAAMARRFGVSATHVSKIVHRLCWKHPERAETSPECDYSI